MKKIIFIVIGCLLTSLSFAQEARSPEELALFIQKAIQTKNTDYLTKLINPSAGADSVEGYKQVITSYHAAANLKVYAVPKDNAEAVRQFIALDKFGTLKPVDEQVKKLESWGSHFAVKPAGYLVISGRQAHDVNPKSEGSMSSAMYGKQDGKYLIVFASRK